MLGKKPNNLGARSQKKAPNISKLDHFEKNIYLQGMWGWMEFERISYQLLNFFGLA